MKLKPDDAALFFRLFFPLLDYVNEKYKVEPGLGRIAAPGKVDLRKAFNVAQFLWKRLPLLDEYLQVFDIPDEYRGIVLKWKRRISGTFIIERHLKKGSVFILTDDASVYMVNGIYSDWNEMLQGASLPIMVKATLIPFGNVIISDGLVSTSNVYFGRNHASEFRKIYMNAKNCGTIKTNI